MEVLCEISCAIECANLTGSDQRFDRAPQAHEFQPMPSSEQCGIANEKGYL